jgi:hypothetical protein
MEPHETELESELRRALVAEAEPVRGDGVQQDVVVRAVARRRRTRRTVRISLAGVAAAAAVAAALLLPSAGDDDSTRTVDDRPTTTTTSTPTSVTSSTTPDRDQPSATASTTDRDTTSTTPTSVASTASSTTSTTSTTTEPPALPAFPPEFTGLTHGGEAWALYLAIAPPGQYDAPELLAADAAAAEAGYGSGGGFGELACDRGAPEALGRDGTSLAAAVYFETQAEAQQAQDAFQSRGQPVVGIVHVETGCLD